jgi:predicted membrane protein
MAWAALFIVIFIAAGILTWDGPISLIPMLTPGLVTLSYSMGNTRFIRICATISSIVWLIYNVTTLSIGGALTEIFCLVSLCIAFWRFDIRKQSEQKEINFTEVNATKE